RNHQHFSLNSAPYRTEHIRHSPNIASFFDCRYNTSGQHQAAYRIVRASKSINIIAKRPPE
ncbi:MAG: hypothetical protein J0J15_10075, partial [Mesorhizobium sp.]|nr:hypothetical protein [Mesorhizobium sp.]